MKKIILTQFIFLMCLVPGFTQSWNLNGNSGTNTATNFIGTTDAHQLAFRVRNQRAGYIDFDSTNGITSFGYRALFSGTGVNNTAFGFQALFSNTTGNSNIALGYSALYSNTTGIHNIAIGQRALYSNIGGHSNVAIGYQALTLNTTGVTSTAVGHGALSYNTTGSSNVANGFNALYNNVSGFYNTACGNNTLFANTSGTNNTAVGFSAGSQSDKNNNCTFLGYDADQTGTVDFTNSMALGNAARITASNQVRIGNISISSIGGQVNWTTLSDGRYKKQVKENVPGLQFINKLKAVTYQLDVTGIRNFLREERNANEDEEKNTLVSNEHKEDFEKSIKEKEKILYTGFIAQEVEKAAKEIGYDFSGVDAPKNADDFYGLRYGEFVVPLVKAVQELDKMIEDRNAKMYAQQQIIEDLQEQINELKAIVSGKQMTTSQHKAEAISINKASLEQNTPNPFTSTTIIGYTLPEKFTNAQIIIADKDGKILKRTTISGTGKGKINIDALALASGAYSYSLIVDGSVLSSKQMILVK